MSQPQTSAHPSHELESRDLGAKLSGALKTTLCFALVFAIAYICFVVGRAKPPYIFWDENYHVTSAERYLEGVAHLEPHPPLGIMLIAAGEALSGANADI